MIYALAFAALVFQQPGSIPIQNQGPTIRTGWSDELHSRAPWGDLDMENRARVSGPPGIFLLSLGHVPSGWPYAYQWSGVKRNLQVDLSRFPVLMAKVNWVKGYAHLDIDVLDGAGKAVKTLRSTTLNDPGLSTIDLGNVLDPAVYSLQIRLIVGGSNLGCEATYDWVRFVNRSDAEFLTKNPDWNKVIPYWITER